MFLHVIRNQRTLFCKSDSRAETFALLTLTRCKCISLLHGQFSCNFLVFCPVCLSCSKKHLMAIYTLKGQAHYLCVREQQERHDLRSGDTRLCSLLSLTSMPVSDSLLTRCFSGCSHPFTRLSRFAPLLSVSPTWILESLSLQHGSSRVSFPFRLVSVSDLLDSCLLFWRRKIYSDLLPLFSFETREQS